MNDTTVCIVGADPAGAMLSLLLARAGVEVVLLEKHKDFLRDFRGDTVHPATLQVLDCGTGAAASTVGGWVCVGPLAFRVSGMTRTRTAFRLRTATPSRVARTAAGRRPRSGSSAANAACWLLCAEGDRMAVE